MRRGTALLGLLALPCAAWFIWGRGPARTYLSVSGRIEAPAGMRVSDHLSVRATRNGWDMLRAPHPVGEWISRTDADGSFQVYVEEGGPVDLQVDEADLLVAARTGSYGQTTPEDIAAAIQRVMETPRPDRVVLRVGAYEALARGVAPGATDVVLRLVPRVARRVSCRVVDLEGAPVPGSQVTLHSLADWIHGTTDGEGRVAFEDVSVREYEVTAQVPSGRPAGVVRSRVLATPDDEELVLALRRGVPIRVRAAWAGDEDLLLGMSPSARHGWYSRAWRPDADGVAVVFAEPDWATVFLHLRSKADPQTGRFEMLAEASAPVREGAEVVLSPPR